MGKVLSILQVKCMPWGRKGFKHRVLQLERVSFEKECGYRSMLAWTNHDCNSLHRSSFKCVEGGGEVLVQSLLKWVRVFAAEG